MDLHETLYRFYITKKLTHVTVTITKNALHWHQYPGPRYIAIIYTVGYPVAQPVILFGRGQSLAWSEINLQLFCIKIISMSQLNFWSITTGYDVKQILAIFFRGEHGLFGLILAALLGYLQIFKAGHFLSSKHCQKRSIATVFN